MRAAMTLPLLAMLSACATSTTALAPMSTAGDRDNAQVAEAASADAMLADSTPQLDRLDMQQTLPAALPIEIDNPYGDVRLRFGGYAHQVEIHGVRQRPPLAAEIAVIPNLDDNRWALAPRLPAGEIVAEGQRLDLVVFVPQGHSVSVRTEHGLVEARGLKSGLRIRSTAGDIAVRGTEGAIDAETGGGAIEASLGAAPSASQQRLVTRTGNIVVAVDDGLNAQLSLRSSGVFATEYSLQVEHLPGQEPNKQASATVGTAAAQLELSSARGEIRLLRRAGFTPAIAVGAQQSSPSTAGQDGTDETGEGNMKRAQAP